MPPLRPTPAGEIDALKLPPVLVDLPAFHDDELDCPQLEDLPTLMDVEELTPLLDPKDSEMPLHRDDDADCPTDAEFPTDTDWFWEKPKFWLVPNECDKLLFLPWDTL